MLHFYVKQISHRHSHLILRSPRTTGDLIRAVGKGSISGRFGLVAAALGLLLGLVVLIPAFLREVSATNENRRERKSFQRADIGMTRGHPLAIVASAQEPSRVSHVAHTTSHTHRDK